MKLYYVGTSDVDLVSTKGRLVISHEGTEVPDELAEAFLKEFPNIIKKKLEKKKVEEVKENGQS